MKSTLSILIAILLLVPISVLSQAKDSDWVIKAEELDLGKYSSITVANGMIGVVSSPNPFQVKEIVVAGAYDLFGRGRVSNLVRTFGLLNMFLEVNKHRIGPGNVSNMKQELHMRKAYFRSTFEFEDMVTVSVSYRALRQSPFSLLMSVEVRAKKDFVMTTGSVMQAPDELRNVQSYYNEITIPGTTMGLLTSSAFSGSGKLKMAASNAYIFEEASGKEPDVVHELLDDNLHQMRFSRMMKKGETYRFAVVGSTITSAHVEDPLNEAERLTVFAKQQGQARLIDMHEKAWAKLWTSDIEIVGDAEVQKDVRSMIYHLYSFVGEGTDFSVSPMGLSGLGYNGHIFWDADTWVFPALLVLQPDLAKNLVNYRFDRLEAARKNAFRHGYKGAMFPWESAANGEEETPVWALSGPFEHHITACVAIAAWNYYAVTQDKDWLAERGWPILSETACFWLSRVEKNSVGFYEIKNVVGADEWAENVDNDAWTNAAVKANLRFAFKAAMLLNKKANVQWLNVADSILIERMEDGVTREHSSYRGEDIKQADVNLLSYPLKEITDRDQILKDLLYYQKRVPGVGTPAMTKSIFALLFARLGEREKAYETFIDSYIHNRLPPFGVLTETPNSYNNYFLTGAGGFLQCIMMGFGGIEFEDGGIVQGKKVLPKKWQSLTIRSPLIK